MDRKEAIEYAKFRLECHTKGDGEYTDYGEFLVAAIAEYDGDFGWVIEGYPQWTDPHVTAWQPLPEPFEESEEK